MATKKASPLTYEKAMAELEACAERLESGELTLDESLKLYEQGMALSKAIEEMLKAGEARLTMLTAGGEVALSAGDEESP